MVKPAHSGRINKEDRRALALYAQLLKLEQMPLLKFEIVDGPAPIRIWENDGRKWQTFSVSTVLSFDLQKAEEAGGDFSALMKSRKFAKPKMPMRIPATEVAKAAEALRTGEEDDEFPLE